MAAPSKIAVAGGTGRVGRHVVDVVRERSYDAVSISRATGVDVITGDGLAAALSGVDCIIDTSTGPSPEQDAATEFFTTATRNLQQAGKRAGVQRMMVVSIIGIDLFTGGYSAAKLAHERAALSGPIPALVLRAAQFHEFVAQLIEWGTQGDVCYVPKMRTQLVAARTVAEALVDLATAPEFTKGEAPFPEIAGPRQESMVDAAKLFVAKRGLPVRVEGGVDPSDPGGLYESGGMLPGPHAMLAGPTFEEWLASQ